MKYVSLVLILFTITGCATVFKGTSAKVNINSDPNKAKVYVNGSFVGKTPTEVKLSSKESHQIEFQKEGYEARGLNLTNNIGVGWIIADILFGVVPLIVDAATGAWFHLESNNIKMNLEKTP